MKEEIDIDDALPDMLLVEDLRTKEGAALLPEGTELTEQLIELLKSKGVAKICVSTMHGPSAASRKTIEVERVNKLFEHHKDQPVMANLRDILVEYFGAADEHKVNS